MKMLVTLGLEVIILFTGIFSLFGYKKVAEPKNIDEARNFLPSAWVNPVVPLPGELVGVKYEYSGGSMVYGSDFYIEVTPDEIIKCGYYDFEDSNTHEMIRKEHLEVSDSLWNDLSYAINKIYESGKFEEIKEKTKDSSKKGSDNDNSDDNAFDNDNSDGDSVIDDDPVIDGDDLIILDGGDYSNLWLSWEKDGQTTQIRYYIPSDRRFGTVRTVLEELANPKGTKIIHYEEPVLCGAFYKNENTDSSFQCTIFNHDPNDYYFIPRFPALNINYSKHLSPDAWELAKPAFEWINPDNYDRGSYENSIVVSLYYSDNTQISLKMDKKAASLIEPYLGFVAIEYNK